MSVVVSEATNRIGGTDANGNTFMANAAYDVENHTYALVGASPYTSYSYDAQNKRVFTYTSGSVDTYGNPINYLVVLYSVSGQKMGTYQISTCNTSALCSLLKTSDQYFGGRRLASMDQLGSVGTYYPWGEAKGTTNPQDTWSYATYWRDSVTGLDYANNRYYTNAYGRFMTPDPSRSSGGPEDPQSWNRYAYTRGDPVNRVDPTGRDDTPSDTCTTSSSDFCITTTITGDDDDDTDDGWDDANDVGSPTPDSELRYMVQLPGLQTGGKGAAKAQYIADRYVLGLSSLKTFSTNSSDCLKDLTAVGLTPTQVDGLATGASFLNYEALPSPQQRINLILRHAILAADSSSQTIYYLPFNLVTESYALQLGDLLHELIHLSGFGGTGPDQDTNLQSALKITKDPSNTGNISDKLAKDCFKGVKNP